MGVYIWAPVRPAETVVRVAARAARKSMVKVRLLVGLA